MEYAAKKPYPKIEVKGKNLFYAQLLSEDYAGMISEATAIYQYVYQKMVKFQSKVTFSDALLKIAIVEMKHLALLGETITLLGLTPKYQFLDSCNHLVNWNSSFINYDTNISEMLKYNIRLEQNTILNYQRHIAMIDDFYVQRLLNRIIEDEVIHIQCFQTLLREYEKNNIC